MAQGLPNPINPLVADVGSPPIPEAQSWTGRYDGSFGPLINLSQAVPGNAPHAGLLERMAAAAGSAAGAQYGPINGDASLRQAYAA
ncbi:MAG TPA: aspartate/tyrosine/aromatic aminotransferase, partial [Microvirga sp.]|nr:aspartate/tyrosine/aromatic aminotransferase [Microvirga sp.]